MPTRHLSTACLARSLAVLLAAGVAAAFCPTARAQDNYSRSVGGISIDGEGVLDSAQPDALRTLSRIRSQALTKVPGPLGELARLRKVSLRRLEAAIDRYTTSGKELPDEIKYLAGLQQIQYVFVDPQQRDIILAGPAEGWKVDKRGFVVGVTTGRPVILLEDLLVALRWARQAAGGTSISCSIDPTAEGLARLQSHVAKLRTIGNPRATASGIERVLGPQAITVEGVPATSHFARVLVAADYRMKRVAMGLAPSPVRSLPSFLQMVQAGPRGVNSMLPRWWLEPSYESVLRDSEGLAWELRGSGVKAMAEEDFLEASGHREHTGKAGPKARRWAESMTAAFPELAVADPVFGQLHNCMDLAVVATLIVKERLPEKAGYSLPVLMQSPKLKGHEFAAPKQVASKASLIKKGRNWIIAASGGVKIAPQATLRRARINAELEARRIESSVGKHDDWWWN